VEYYRIVVFQRSDIAHTQTHTDTRSGDGMGSVAWQRQSDEMNRWHSLHACAGGHDAAERGGGDGGGGDGEEGYGKFKIYTGISWRSVLAHVAGIKKGPSPGAGSSKHKHIHYERLNQHSWGF
jgi:hypothetical protein